MLTASLVASASLGPQRERGPGARGRLAGHGGDQVGQHQGGQGGQADRGGRHDGGGGGGARGGGRGGPGTVAARLASTRAARAARPIEAAATTGSGTAESWWANSSHSQRPAAMPDRKSTRLNSSHLG